MAKHSILDALNEKLGVKGKSIVDALNKKNGTKSKNIAEAVTSLSYSGSGAEIVKELPETGDPETLYITSTFGYFIGYSDRIDSVGEDTVVNELPETGNDGDSIKLLSNDTISTYKYSAESGWALDPEFPDAKIYQNVPPIDTNSYSIIRNKKYHSLYIYNERTKAYSDLEKIAEEGGAIIVDVLPKPVAGAPETVLVVDHVNNFVSAYMLVENEDGQLEYKEAEDERMPVYDFPVLYMNTGAGYANLLLAITQMNALAVNSLPEPDPDGPSMVVVINDSDDHASVYQFESEEASNGAYNLMMQLKIFDLPPAIPKENFAIYSPIVNTGYYMYKEGKWVNMFATPERKFTTCDITVSKTAGPLSSPTYIMVRRSNSESDKTYSIYDLSKDSPGAYIAPFPKGGHVDIVFGAADRELYDFSISPEESGEYFENEDGSCGFRITNNEHSVMISYTKRA